MTHTAFSIALPGRGVLALAAGLAAGLALASAQPAAANMADDMTRAPVHEVVAGSDGFAGELTVAAGKSRLLRFASPVRDVMLGDPDVADIVPISDRSVYLLGRKVGSTSLTAFSSSKRLVAVMDLQVSYDTGALKRRLYELMPHEDVQVRASGDGLVLSGVVSSSAAADRAMTVAEQFAPDKVANLMSVQAAEQVMLSVRVAEIQRRAAKQLGLRSNVFYSKGDDFGGMLSGILNPDAFSTFFGNFTPGDYNIQMALDALEEKGVITTLAEPNLVAMSGETASFLAGGEFPIPVAQNVLGDDSRRVTIEFKQFGVSVAFTPTVYGETINLAVAPEVSALDPQNGVEFDGLEIPGLVTRRASTSVELKNGQSFAIAGLIRHEFLDAISQTPGIAEAPVLGALFRSAEFAREESELAIIVTAHFAQPAAGGELTVPTDHFLHPSELELFALGRVGGGESPLYRRNDDQKTAAAVAGDKVARRTAGYDGNMGYVLK
jgi:pilus assembly protein CpaC